MLEVLEQFQLTVRSLSENRSAKGLHDFLNRHRLPRELILGRTTLDI
jgi:hypothetical protein